MADASRSKGPVHQEAIEPKNALNKVGCREMPLPFMTTRQAGIFLRLSPRTLSTG